MSLSPYSKSCINASFESMVCPFGCNNSQTPERQKLSFLSSRLSLIPFRYAIFNCFIPKEQWFQNTVSDFESGFNILHNQGRRSNGARGALAPKHLIDFTF